MKLAFIGGGFMGEAMIAGAVESGISPPDKVSVYEVLTARGEYLAATHGIRVAHDAASAVRDTELVVLAVKPQDFPSAGAQLSGCLRDGQVVVSIMAGVSIAAIVEAVGFNAVVRTMPNTPARIGEGMTVWTASAAVTAQQLDGVKSLLGVLGKEIRVDSEKYIDMATAVSGSGPGYVFLVAEAMIDAAVHIGLRRDVATPMVIQTLLGSARYAAETGLHPAELRNQVTSPGGTTAEGLLALEDAGLRAAFLHAIEAAYDRARELGGQS
jgi:pyrroline-5-carboxylate reductase